MLVGFHARFYFILQTALWQRYIVTLITILQIKKPTELSDLNKLRARKRQRQGFNPGLTAPKPAL